MDIDMRVRSPTVTPPPSSGYQETPVKFALGRGKNKVPRLVHVECHPQWPYGPVALSVYDFKTTNREDYRHSAKDLRAPFGASDKRMREEGWQKLIFGQAQFARVEGGDAKDDVFQEVQFNPDLINTITHGGVDRFNAVMKEILGDQSLRSPERPVRDDTNVKRGGVHFERGLDRHLHHTHQGDRCYSTMTSTQYLRGNLVAPSSNMKGPPDADIELRKRLNEVSLSV